MINLRLPSALVRDVAKRTDNPLAASVLKRLADTKQQAGAGFRCVGAVSYTEASALVDAFGAAAATDHPLRSRFMHVADYISTQLRKAVQK